MAEKLAFIDARRTLPRHPTKRWALRSVPAIKGIVWHHTSGGDDPVATANYHVGPNHVSATGEPGIGYTFYVRRSGAVWWCNDLGESTWSQGQGSRNPDVDGDGDQDAADGVGAANASFLAIVFGGSFESAQNHSGEQPSAQQLLAGLALVGHLVGATKWTALPDILFGALGHLDVGDVWAHADFGKDACPGDRLGALTQWLRWHRRLPRTVKEWQARLVAAGHPIAVDGAWGPKSYAALVAFQEDSGIAPTGNRDEMTERALFG